ncbi:MAG TPA: PQQ-binding-like beta-propeller repeat protein, partial [Planctomycetaceae bacterium]|nr:PQQ-binding-like beta-propeller repeat protein [Planctomycetaceae bacterium]
DRFGKEGWLSLRERALRLILKLPDEVVRTFRQRWSVEAQRRLEEAEQSGRADQIARVATRFFLTDAGHAAADRLGTRHLDRGESALATRWFRLLADAHAPVTTDRRWQIKAAMAAKLAGQTELAERWWKGDGSHAATEQLEVGGEMMRLSDWWQSLKSHSPGLHSLTEWLMFFGAASRAGTFAGGEPLLLPRWQHSLTQIQPLQRQIEMLVEDCHDVNRSTLTVSQPVLVDGLVALRTLGGVQVFDLECGRPRWSTAERWPAETLISPGQATYFAQSNVFINGMGWGGGRFNVNFDFSAQGIEQNPLAQLLFANGNFGQLSSDGRQLFVVEDDTFVMQGNGYWGGQTDMSRVDPLRRSWSSNKLVSYDLRSGRPLWTVGGVESDEAFRPELPGVFFFGAPTPDGNDLFIVGERDGEVRLYCLQATTGKPQWSQLLATAEMTISRDPVRRSFTAQVAVADGVVVCPTTVGWLVAVDRASHQLLWVHRYSTPQALASRSMPNQSLTVHLPWGQRWCPSAPVIAGDAVVFTPQEMFDEQNLRTNILCIGLHNGTRRWSKPKESWLALNGVADGKVLLLGQSDLGALSLANGSDAWKTTIATGDGVPSGLGSVTGDRWHVPLSSGQLWTVSWKDGSLISRQWAPPGTRRENWTLGNLSLYRGSLVSAHATGLACFEQREATAAQIRERKEHDPGDPLALLTEASILQLERKSDAAWNVLKSLRDESVPP